MFFKGAFAPIIPYTCHLFCWQPFLWTVGAMPVAKARYCHVYFIFDFHSFASIFGDIGEYEPMLGVQSNSRKEKKSSKPAQYFQKISNEVSVIIVNQRG